MVWAVEKPLKDNLSVRLHLKRRCQIFIGQWLCCLWLRLAWINVLLTINRADRDALKYTLWAFGYILHVLMDHIIC